MRHGHPWLNGWPLVGWAALAIALMTGAILVLAGVDEAGLRMLVRATARTSVVLFTAAFVASAARRVWPGPATAWLLANRRQVGVSFAVSHFVHLLALIALFGPGPRRWVANGVIGFVFGGIGYVLLAAMTATSFDRTARWLGPRRWKRLHTIGAYYIWFIFAISYIPRAVVESRAYAPVAILIVAALIFRLSAPSLVGRRGRSDGGS